MSTLANGIGASMIDGFGPSVVPEPVELPPVLPVLPLRDLVLYPFIIVPLSVSRDRSLRAVECSMNGNRKLLLLAQRTEAVDNPGWPDLYRVGTAATMLRMLRLPDGRVRILVQGTSRARVDYPTEETDFLQARVCAVSETERGSSLEGQALVRSVTSGLERIVALGKSISSEVMVIASNLQDPGRLADLTASNLDLKVAEAQELLEIEDPLERLRLVISHLNREAELLEMQQQITTRARSEIDRTQREYYLRQQLKAIERELGEGSDGGAEVLGLKEKLRVKRMPDALRDDVLKQVDKLGRLHPDGAETATLRNYLEWVATLPWGNQSKDRIHLGRARKVLDADHHGLERVKDRILEFLAVRKLRPEAKGPILCFVGPPGVGKTSLGQSIARSLGRRFTRLSLGGVRDEAEIRGHRRTYVGALPGRILQGLEQAGTSNPVFMIDEVDKIGSDFRGDPSAALLEVLDPEQNATFRDHYLSLPYDLSSVLFIATANQVDTIEAAFRDRMEVVPIEGYTEEEKLEITRRHLLPRQLREHGLARERLRVSDEAVLELIRGYTREAGLRNLERELAALCRKVARAVAEGRPIGARVSATDLASWLGPPRLLGGSLLTADRVGVATGLAWTAAGGEILLVEALVMPGKGDILITGQLGSVMRESAQAALSLLRARGAELGLDARFSRHSDLHLHVPEGATPKDGPSAGVAMATALCSALTGRAVRHDIAMTGEITLRGEVLAVGGIKEKLLAARRAGVAEVIFPERNRKDLVDVPEVVLRELRLHPVSDIREVLARTLRPRAERHTKARQPGATGTTRRSRKPPRKRN